MKTNFDNPTEEQKELIRYWIERFNQSLPYPFTSLHSDFIEKHLSKKPNIEVGKWYKAVGCVLGRLFLGYITEIKDGKFYYYGLNCCGDWTDKDWYSNFGDITEATEQEVTERLIEEAKRRGYKPGNFKCLYMPHQEPANLTGDFYSEWTESDGVLIWMGNEEDYILCYEKGKWAEIIPDKKLPAPSELEDAIKALDNATEKLKNLLK